MKPSKPVPGVRSLAVLIAGSMLSMAAMAADPAPAAKAAAAAPAAAPAAKAPAKDAAAPEDPIAAGKQIAFDQRKGNCLACHEIPGGESPGNIGPPLFKMQARFPDKATLRTRVSDATAVNPNSLMPPFGRHKILSGDEIDKVVEFLWTL